MKPIDLVHMAVWEGASLVVMARVYSIANVAITQASLTSIACDVYDLTDRSQTGDLTPVIASTVFDTLQTGSRWTIDSTGYNFLYTIPGSAFPTGGRTYKVRVIFTPTSGDPFYLVGVVSCGKTGV